jgi:hypothetical protein
MNMQKNIMYSCMKMEIRTVEGRREIKENDIW